MKRLSGLLEPDKMYRVTEPGKYIRFDPNLDPNLTILQE